MLKFGRYLLVLAAAVLVINFFGPQSASAATYYNATSATPSALAETCSTGSNAIYSFAASKYVSPNLTTSAAPLQARADNVGAWEKFCIVQWSRDEHVIISIAANKFVSARMNEPGYPLRASADTVGTWEKFSIGYVDGAAQFLSLANRKYVSARMNEPGYPLQASVDFDGPWERFCIC
ncbi:fascin domain-containing protein [Micromonospora terminaliae]|uniref:fascin domain-containing protein n=1 Tax=Micromonospora terminaliae TaxID=1914461 RepID=UPI00142EFA20|nr:hypothetical protein [Micromonospora terminaliae]